MYVNRKRKMMHQEHGTIKKNNQELNPISRTPVLFQCLQMVVSMGKAQQTTVFCSFRALLVNVKWECKMNVKWECKMNVKWEYEVGSNWVKPN